MAEPTGEPLDRPILRLAVPGLLASVSVPLIGIVDTAMVGHLPEVAFLGAVATASALFDVLFWGAGFLRMGTTSIVAQHFGAGDRQGCGAAMCRSLLLALVLGAAVLALRVPLSRGGFQLLGAPAEVQAWGQRYFDVRVLAVPLVLATFALNGFFLGTANAVAPLAITATTTAVNTAGDYALIFGHWGAPAMGVEGAAWAAVAAAAAGAAVGAAILLLQYRGYFLPVRITGLFEPARLRHLAGTNLGLFGRTLCLLGAQFALVALVARMGQAALAAHAVVWQLWSLVSYGVDGFAHAAEALVGNSLGSGDFARARGFARRILVWGGSIGALFGVAYAAGLEGVAGLFTPHAEVVAAAATLTPIVALMQPLNALVYVFDGVFIGANDVGFLFRAMAGAALACFAPAALVLVVGLDGGLVAAWAAYAALMVGRFVPLALRYRGDAWVRTFLGPSAAPATRT